MKQGTGRIITDENGNTTIFCGTVFRTASIDYLKLKVAYADFKSKTFGEDEVFYFGDISDSDEKILKTISAETGKVYQAIVEKSVESGLYRISTMNYAIHGEHIGDARERKTH